MSKVFDSYAHYYDLMYSDKDYASEAEYIAAHIRRHLPDARSILELGCGTGAHAVNLVHRGFTLHGVDLSDAMVGLAETRKAMLSSRESQCLTFSVGDVRTIRTNMTYDAVISLFHVISYQNTNADLDAVFEAAAIHLKPGGVFLFDFWYGPAVLTQKPEVRVKRLADEHIKVTRIAEPVMHVNDNVVDVNYTVLIEVKETGRIEQLQEIHRMRYLFLPEVKRLLETHGFTFGKAEEWMSSRTPDLDTWGVCIEAYK